MNAPAIAESAPTSPASPERKAQVETLLKGILEHMAYPARLELKDMPDGGIGVAVHFEGDLPGITPSKRSWLVDCIQFLVNKSLNRPNLEKRWVTLGVDAFPEPRGQRPEPQAQPQPAAAQPRRLEPVKNQAQVKGPPPGRGQTPARAQEPRQPAPRNDGRGQHVDEHKLEPAEDPVVTRVFTALAEKAAKSGRLYAVMALSVDDRARALKAISKVKGVSAKVEGEGHWRRLTLTPEKLVPLPTRQQVMPDYDEEE